MRNIRKGEEPRALTEYRMQADATYETLPGKDQLRNALVAEQRGLCCYCMGRISAEWGRIRIEHWQSQSAHPDQQLNWRNLLGACNGGHGGSLNEQHCDVRKGDRDLSRNPADPSHEVEALIRYPPDGRIESTNAPFDAELNDVLNLNAESLKSIRRATLSAFLKSVHAKGKWRTDSLKRLRAHWNGDSHNDHLAPYCQVVVYWIDERLKRV